MSRRRLTPRGLVSPLIDYLYSFRHWWRWKVRQRPHTGWPEALGFFVTVAFLLYFLMAYL